MTLKTVRVSEGLDFGVLMQCSVESKSIIIISSGNELVSDLALQMALYFNAYYSPFWFVTCCVMLGAKVRQL